jgi:hypothetical protein
MKLFRLTSLLLTTTAITHAQIILGTIAAIELGIVISEAAAEVAELAIEAEIEITAAMEAGAAEVSFAAGVNTVTTTLDGAALDAVAGAFEVETFTESAAVGATTEVLGGLQFARTIAIQGQDVAVQVLWDINAGATVGADGAVGFANGVMNGVNVIFPEGSTLSGIANVVTIAFAAAQ